MYTDGNSDSINPDLLYLGNILQLKEIVPLEGALETYGLYELKVFEVGHEEFYLCKFADGEITKIKAFRRNGTLFFELKNEYRQVETDGNHIVGLTESELHLYRFKEKSLGQPLSVPISPIANFLQKEAVYAESSSHVDFGGFLFEVSGEAINFWFFNVNTTAFPSASPHLKVEYSLETKTFVTFSGFGTSTRTDRMPTPFRSFSAAKIEKHLWVPRTHDNQVDVFDKGGNLLKTISLPPVYSEMSTGSAIGSKEIWDQVISGMSTNELGSLISRQNYPESVAGTMDFVLVKRRNINNLKYGSFFTALNRNGDVLTEDAWSRDIMINAATANEFLSIIPLSENADYLPEWLLESSAFDPLAYKNHSGWWLAKFQVKGSLISDQKASEKPSGSVVTPRLKKSLAGARQLRNLMDFKGFIKLDVPDEFGVREVSSLLVGAKRIFLVDSPGRQVLMFDGAGQFMGPMGRRGSGPGEFNRPNMILRGYGDRVILVGSHELLVYDENGTYERKFQGRQKDFSLAGGPIIWDQPDRLFLSDPFHAGSGKWQYGYVDVSSEGALEITGFGERFAYYDRQFDTTYGTPIIQGFVRVGEQIWLNPPFEGTLEIYDQQGELLAVPEGSKYAGGLSKDDFRGVKNNLSSYEFFKATRKGKIKGTDLHVLGPVVVRTLTHPVHGIAYDVFDHSGQALARMLEPGASMVQIKDTRGENLYGTLMLPINETLDRESLKKFLYRPEWEALMEAGYQDGDDPFLYIWSARLGL